MQPPPLPANLEPAREFYDSLAELIAAEVLRVLRSREAEAANCQRGHVEEVAARQRGAIAVAR